MFYKVLGVFISVLSLSLYLYYFVHVSVEDHTYISDNLHNILFFRISASILLVAQHILLAFYFYEFKSSQKYFCFTGILFILVTLGGWFLLTAIYTSPWHMIGFSIFVSGLFVYWIIIFILDQMQLIADHEEYVIFLSSFIFCILYCIFYVSYNSISWFYEHIGMIFLNCAFIYFFMQHNADPTHKIMIQKQYNRVIPVVI